MNVLSVVGGLLHGKGGNMGVSNPIGDIAMVSQGADKGSDEQEGKKGGNDEEEEFELAQNSPYLSSFLLLNTMIGSGILNQPYVFYNGGIIGGMVGFLLASLATWYSLLILTHAGISANIFEYSGLAQFAFGRAGESLIDVCIIITAFGAILGYILLVGQIISALFVSWGCESEGCNVYSVTILASAILVAPLCLFRHFGHLAWLSVFSLLTITLVLFLVLIGGPILGQEKRDESAHINTLNGLGALQSLGSIVFALSCAPANFQAFISTEESSRNMESWVIVTRNAVFVGALMCCVMGLAGYLSFRRATKGDVLSDFTDPAFDFWKIMVITHLIVYIPVNFVIMRYSIVNITIHRKSESLHFVSHTILSLSLLTALVVTVLSLLAAGLGSGKAFGLVLDITGGIGGSMSTFVLPSAIYLKTMPENSRYTKHAYVLFFLGWMILVSVLTGTILSAIYN